MNLAAHSHERLVYSFFATRHPKYIFGPRSDSWNLEDDFGLSTSDLDLLESYEAIENAGQSFEAILGGHMLSGWTGLVLRAEVVGGGDDDEEKEDVDGNEIRTGFVSEVRRNASDYANQK